MLCWVVGGVGEVVGVFVDIGFGVGFGGVVFLFVVWVVDFCLRKFEY